MYSKTQSRFVSMLNGLMLRTPPAPMITISPGSTSRTNSASMMSRAQVSDAMIQASAEPADHQGPHAERVAHPDHRILRQRTDRIGALHLMQRIDQTIDDGILEARRDQMDDHFGVAGRIEQAAAPHELPPELIGIGQIAVMADRHSAEFEIAEKRLDVAFCHFAGRGIPDMADCGAALEALHHLFRGEIVGDETRAAMMVELGAVIADDAGGFLAAMLQGVQPQRGQCRRVGMAVDPENATFFVEMVSVGAGARHIHLKSGLSAPGI